MGGELSDLYEIEAKDSFQLKDTRPPKYIWVDPKIRNPQNSAHSIIFQQNQIEMIEIDSFQELARKIDRSSSQSQKLRVVCAASLEDQAYERIQQSEKIDRALLFCNNRIRANDLLRMFPKIKSACFGSWEVARIIKLWEKQSETSLLFFQEASIEVLNKYYSNILSLVDSKNIVIPAAKAQFDTYLQKIAIKQRRQLQKILIQFQKARINKELMNSFIERYLVAENPLIKAVNQLLISTFKPKKLAYIRYIINDLFHGIKNFHANRQQAPFKKYYGLVEVSEAELRELVQSKQKSIMFTYFLHGDSQPSQKALMSHQLDVIIHIPPKMEGRFSNGYFHANNKILFNLGTYFKVTSFSQESKALTVTLLQIPDNIQANLNKYEDCIYLNRIYQQHLHQKYDGQWYSLLLNNGEQAANDIMSEKVKALSKIQEESERFFKYKINMVARKLKNSNNQIEVYEKMLAQLERAESRPRLIQCLALGCEFYLNHQRTDKFNELFRKLQWHKDIIVTNDIKNRFILFKIAFELKKASSQNQALRAIQELHGLQRKFLSNNEYICNQFYPLLLKVKIIGLIRLNQTLKALESLSILSKIYTVCQGTTSVEHGKLQRLREEIETSRKRTIYQSSIDLEDLRRQRYQVEVYPLDFTLYQ